MAELEVAGIEIINGYDKDNKTEKLYYANSRVKKIRIEFSDKSSIEKELKDETQYYQSIDFEKTIKTNYIKITILEVYKGGWQIEFGVTGDAISAGMEATIGIFDGEFQAKANASLGVGGGFVFRAKPPQ